MAKDPERWGFASLGVTDRRAFKISIDEELSAKRGT